MSIEDRVRAATRARTDLVRDIRPLELPDEAPGRARRVLRSWGGWLVPVAAAAVVVALALTLVAVRHAAAPAPAPAPAGAAPAAVLAKIPRYYAVISQDGSTRDFTIVDDRTGKQVESFAAPGNSFLDGVSVSSDDRTFILTFRDVVNEQTTRWTVWKIRLFPHPGQVSSTAEIAVKNVDHATELNAWLSPGGREVAILAEQVTGDVVTTTVQAYHASQSSPGPLRTWTTTLRGAAPTGGLSWRTEQSLVFNSPVFAANRSLPPAYSQERALNTTSPSGDLMKASRVLFSGPPPSNPVPCGTVSLTPDDATAICGSQISAGDGASGCGETVPGLAAYSVSTGKLQRVLASYQGPCDSGTAVPVWSDTTASTVIGLFTVTSGRSASRTVLGVAAGGRLYSLPLPVTPASGSMTIAF